MGLSNTDFSFSGTIQLDTQTNESFLNDNEHILISLIRMTIRAKLNETKFFDSRQIPSGCRDLIFAFCNLEIENSLPQKGKGRIIFSLSVIKPFRRCLAN